MCSIMPEAWNIHTVIMFQHESIVHGSAALPHHCAICAFVYKPLFTYNILPSRAKQASEWYLIY